MLLQQQMLLACNIKEDCIFNKTIKLDNNI